MRSTDIRKLMDFYSNTVRTIEETSATSSKVLNDLLRFLKTSMDESDHIVVENLSDYLVDFFNKVPGSKTILSDQGMPSSLGEEFRWVSAQFKQRYGLSLVQYADQVQDQQALQDAPPADHKDAQIIGLIGDKLTSRVSLKWLQDNTYFARKGKKVFIADRHMLLPAAVFGRPSLMKLALSANDFVEWLKANGIEERPLSQLQL